MPQQQTFSDVEPIQAAQTFSNVVPIDGGKQPGWLDRQIPLDSYTHATESGIQSVARGTRDAVMGTLQTLDPRPKNQEEEAIVASDQKNRAALPLYRILRSIGHTATDATQLAGAFHDINQSPDPVGTYAKVAQETAGQGAGQALTALATEGVVKGAGAAAPAVSDAASAAASKVAQAAKVGGQVIKDAATPENIGTAVGSAAGGYLGHLVGEPVAAGAAGAALGRAVGKSVAKKLMSTPEAPVFPGASLPEHPGVFPGASLPETPAPELLQANALSRGAQAVVDPAAGLGQIKQSFTDVQPLKAAPQVRPNEVAQPVPPAAPAVEGSAAPPSAAAPPPAAGAAPVQAPTPQTAKATLTDLQQQIKDSLGGKTAYEMAGGKPLQDGVSLKNQPPQTNLQQQIKDAAEPAAPQTPKAPQTDLQGQIKAAGQPPLPQDFTATPDSSLLKGYKYDPAKKQFSVILNDGKGAQTGVPDYVHGEVSPEQVKAFENADSQGSAWTKKIKQGPGTVLVETDGVPFKPIGARRVVVDPATGAKEFSDVLEAKQNAGTTQTAQPAPQAAPAAAAGDPADPMQRMLDAVMKAKSSGTSARSAIDRLVKGEAGQAGMPGSVTDADEGIADIQNRPVLATKTGEVPARGFLRTVGADENSVLKTQGDLDSVFYHRQQIAKNGTPSVELHVDEGGNVIGAQGRHRALAAVQQGGPNAKVNVTIYKHPSLASPASE